MKCTSLLLSGLLSVAYAAQSSTLVAAVNAKRKTLTYTTTRYIQINTTVTGHVQYPTSVTYTKPYYYPSYVYVYTGTPTTETYTETETAHTALKANSTTHVPQTTPGFVPILKESPYTDKIKIITVTSTTTSTSTYDPSPTPTPGNIVFGYEGITTITTTAQSTAGAVTTVTITSTSTPGVATKYAACRGDNLATKVPTGQPVNVLGENGDTEDATYYTNNAEDCCAICQGTPNCFGGGWVNKPGVGYGDCFIQYTTGDNSDETCNGTNAYGIFGYDERDYYDTSYPYFTYVVFNGPCGQLSWYYPEQGLSTGN